MSNEKKTPEPYSNDGFLSILIFMIITTIVMILIGRYMGG